MYDPKKHGFGDSLKIKDRTFPVQGQQYTVEPADNLLKISEWAYGYRRTQEIVDANPVLQQRIKSGRIHGASLGGIPIVYVGDVLMIPQLSEPVPEPVDIEDKSEFQDDVVIRINGIILYGFTVNGFQRSINSIADAFTFSAPYNPENPNSELLDANTYYTGEMFIDGKLFIKGICTTWDYNQSKEQTTASIQVRSKAGVLIDCPSTDTRLNYTSQTFGQIAENILRPFGIALELPYDDTGIINKVKRDSQEKVFDFLAKLAKAKGFILNSTKTGNLKLDRANIDGEPILNLIQGDQKIIGNPSTGFDGAMRFSTFQAISQTKGNASNNSGEIRDDSITAYRPNIFSADNNESGEIEDAAKWERARSLSNSTKISISYSGWRDKNNKIILENETVTLYYPKLCIHKEVKLLIEQVQYSDNPKQVNLSLALPQAYTLDFPTEEGWFWQREK